MTQRQIKYVPEDVGASMREAYHLLYGGSGDDEEHFMKYFNTVDAILNKRSDQTFKLLAHLKPADIGKYIVVDGKRSGVLTDYTRGFTPEGRGEFAVVLDGKIWSFMGRAIVLVEESSKS